jgi:hypothetical protein
VVISDNAVKLLERHAGFRTRRRKVPIQHFVEKESPFLAIQKFQYPFEGTAGCHVSRSLRNRCRTVPP